MDLFPVKLAARAPPCALLPDGGPIQAELGFLQARAPRAAAPEWRLASKGTRAEQENRQQRRPASHGCSCVQAQVPLLWTVYALVSFRGFHMLPAEGEASRPAFYQPPPEYTRKALHESLSKGAKGPSGRSGLALGGLAGLEDEDLY